MKTHKNKSKLDCHWVIGVMMQDNEVRFVTEVSYSPKEAKWEAGKSPMFFESKSCADDIAFGLLVNGYVAIVMELPEAVTIRNKDIYD